MKYRIKRPQKLSAKVSLPASKSISNRALILNALSGAPSDNLANVSDCDDTAVMMEALSLLAMERRKDDDCREPTLINVQAAGTAMRFLTALLAVVPGTHTITGTERMCHRPIGVLVEALRSLGAQIEYLGEEGFPPLRITGKRLAGGTVRLAGDVSSQYISALLMIAPQLERGLTVNLRGTVVSRPYINMTLKMMRSFGADAKWRGGRTLSVAPKPYYPTPYIIESDWSAASYWYEMLLLSDNSSDKVILRGLHNDSLQGDSAVQELFQALSVHTSHVTSGGVSPHTKLIRRGRMTKALEYDFSHTPDLVQTMVVGCAMKGIPFTFSGVESLRIKETDRIAALQTELEKLGVRIEVDGNSIIRWAGPEAQADGSVPYLRPTPGTVIHTYDDHRMAMAFAPVSLVLGSIDIDHPEVVSKSYPHFWQDLEEAGFDIEVIKV